MSLARTKRGLVFKLIFSMIFSFWISQNIYAQTDKDSSETSEIDYKKEAPDFELPDLDGKMVQLQDYKDKILVLHIATTWCPFCNAEAPHLEKLYQEYKDKGVEVLIIDVKEPKELVEQQLKKKHDLSFPILLDTDGEVAASFAPEKILPELSRDEVMLASNLIIDQEGKIRFMSLLDSKNFDAELLALKEKLNELL
ncbi:peroxiredoxin [Christiangramia gaetbulicola]|uniref:Peroxiredoxin n=1 Tax=Christiangramia gaetbulicola TaxID=703340 RepID=A0A2T6AMX1_9FLAO|nr:TlpA disulfide reductase family protein [Christiangramia gaetbulicola]PTX45150.1 peroxiredoxin [Christiangramia gaetbulicola]